MHNYQSDSVIKFSKYNVTPYSSESPGIAVNRLREQNVDGLILAPYRGFSGTSLDFLSAFKNIKILVIQDLPEIPLEPLKFLVNLEELFIDETNGTINLEWLPRLKVLSVHWHKNIFKNEECSNVDSLHMWKFQSSSKNLTDVPFFPKLSEFELVQSSILNLNGISKFNKLRKVELHNMKKLENLGRLELPELEFFVANSCPKILDHEELASCIELKDIKLNRAGSIKSLRFVDRLVKLKTLRFLYTDVIDGDLSPLLRLEDSYFTEKRHFSLRLKDVKQKPRDQLPQFA